MEEAMISVKTLPFLPFFFLLGLHNTFSYTDPNDVQVLLSLKEEWKNTPPTWKTSVDPCGDLWEGVTCNGYRVTELKLPSIGLEGHLSGAIGDLTELTTLDLSFNKKLTGPLSPRLGDLRNLRSLILAACGFSGNIPEHLGNLTQLMSLALNSNKLIGPIPPTLGKLSKLVLLDLMENKLNGPLPVSTSDSHGLDLLHQAQHFHLSKNKLSGSIPPKLFSADMKLIHIVFDQNQFSGSIPQTLGLVNTLEVLRLDRNSLTGMVPSNLTKLRQIMHLNLAHNNLAGQLPNLTQMTSLCVVDLSNNSFDTSAAPDWFSSLPSLTTLIVEFGQLKGSVPETIFSLPQIQQIKLKYNLFDGTLSMGGNINEHLELVDLENNRITELAISGYNKTLMLGGNPACDVVHVLEENSCQISQLSPKPNFPSHVNCETRLCSTGEKNNPQSCECQCPYVGSLQFRGPSIRELSNDTLFLLLKDNLSEKLHLPIGSIVIQKAEFDSDDYLQIQLELYPPFGKFFSYTEILRIASALSHQTFLLPAEFGSFYFIPSQSPVLASDERNISGNRWLIGIAIGCALLVLSLIGLGIYAIKQKKRVSKAISLSRPFSSWSSTEQASGDAPQLKGAIYFSYDELRKMTNNFSNRNEIGVGGYGKVYRGMTGYGQMFAIKRAKQGSKQGAFEFKTEIELLSRVHHKNLVALVGFCCEQGEQMLVYEFMPNGSLQDILGTSYIHLDWKRRLMIALDSARGIAYLHEFANPPAIHRDIKSSNILLDEYLNAKVADFGLSKPVFDDGKAQLSTGVKGTWGYLDPEYYTTQQLTEKSDVYSFGVVMLELITAKPAIEKGICLVGEVIRLTNKSDKAYYGLMNIIDATIRKEIPNVREFGRFLELAIKCVEESTINRPTMSQVVKEIESMLPNICLGGPP
ncbi:probable leucine-rich repeat receptor-like protein kinase At5g49770 [Cucurbita maxima]|uniref:non-specific serine/threonine protein kinase n=1 Tax=Cucurbita maxima TaxID=3661 RepID=A0A6J1ICB4_CUCMA|nr:probable leucine-rich repeat receptor-like protein kinase At5g49770 [Cucurbita maxima]